MYEAPTHVTDAEVLALVRELWAPAAESATHVAAGYGAWHWRMSVPGGDLFATLDQPLWHTAESLEATYAAAAALGLDFAITPLVGAYGRHTAPLADGWLSCTPWVDGAAPSSFGEDAAEMIRRLHAAPPPAGIRSWAPHVSPDLASELRAWTGEPWESGPHGPEARDLVVEGMGRLDAWLAEYLDLCTRLDPTTYVVTHGEPGVHNQWRAADGRLLIIDWETLRLAPRERDVSGGLDAWLEGDPALVRLFALEWRLSEVRSFADWLRGPHGGADADVALRALRWEIRPDEGPNHSG